MKNVTLKEYFDLKGICKGKGGVMNYGQFANKVGVSISYISKLVNCMPLSQKDCGKFEIIKLYVAKDGYNLIKGSTFDLGMNKILKDNDKLKEEVRCLRLENQLLMEQNANYKSLVKLCILIIENEYKLDSITFSCRNSKNKGVI